MKRCRCLRGKERFEYMGKPDRTGHRFYRDRQDNRVAIADDSGQFPDDTDDGVLFIDLSRVLVVSLYGDKISCSVPVVDDDGEPSHTGSSVVEAAWIVGKLQNKVEFTDDIEKLAEAFAVLAEAAN